MTLDNYKYYGTTRDQAIYTEFQILNLLAAEYGVRLIVGMLWQLFKLCSAVESPDSDVHMLAKVVGTTAPGCYQNLWTLAICSRGTLDDTVNDGFRFSIASYPISEREPHCSFAGDSSVHCPEPIESRVNPFLQCECSAL
jgi:hypothetical protein